MTHRGYENHLTAIVPSWSTVERSGTGALGGAWKFRDHHRGMVTGTKSRARVVLSLKIAVHPTYPCTRVQVSFLLIYHTSRFFKSPEWGFK